MLHVHVKHPHVRPFDHLGNLLVTNALSHCDSKDVIALLNDEKNLPEILSPHVIVALVVRVLK
jgi:hypothetical protein